MTVLTSEEGSPTRITPESSGPECIDCKEPADYFTDEFGIRDRVARCSACHEQACRRNLRHDVWLRYG